MNQLLFDRSTGSLGPPTFARLQSSSLLHAVQHAPNICFGEAIQAPGGEQDSERGLKTWAHQAGVNALVVDRFEGRLLLSGGADSGIKIWDLECLTPTSGTQVLKPSGAVTRTASTHKYGITNLSFYPFDSAAFLSSSYDHTLKLYSTDTLAVSASFDLDSIIYTHALSPVAAHLLVACATQHPAIRLVDLRTGSSAHSLAGHHGAVLAVSWSPTRDHVLASGGTDGTVRLWDVRMSSGTLGLLNMEDSIGFSHDSRASSRRSRDHGKAHTGAVNGLTWTDNGAHIVSAGHDERIRVWDASTGANTLASFGPTLKNSHLSTISLLPSPTALTRSGRELLYYPNEHEVLLFQLHEGKLLRRLRVPGPVMAAVRSSRTGERAVRNRVTSLAWRGPVEGMLSGHTDGQIRAWVPRTVEDEMEDREELGGTGEGDQEEEEQVRKRRKVLDDVFRDLTRQKITFG
ncbi:MAG: hypothetical protein M1818_002735 [Claussenomyces sp. TS43310]|nr:MAG: hypothetical protein M1818_002735 [Claussenomyces sp. TS43310]